MNEKYLPIGTVCTLKGKTKKVMIVGVYGVEFNGNLKINDYYGYAYPEGLLLPQFMCAFNHTDIESVDFLGYKNDDYNKFNSLLGRLNNNEEPNSDWVLASSQTYSKLLFDENGVVVLAEQAEPEKTVETKTSANQIKFDENGIVIADDTQPVSNPFYKDYNSVSNVEPDKSDNNIFSKYKFDENGILIADETENNTKSKSQTSQIKFDENGIVIADGTENNTKNESKSSQIKFDENGIVIADGVSTTEAKHNTQYRFDENGILIAVENND